MNVMPRHINTFRFSAYYYTRTVQNAQSKASHMHSNQYPVDAFKLEDIQCSTAAAMEGKIANS